MDSESQAPANKREREGTATTMVAPLLLTIEEAARALAVGRTTLYEMMWRGELTPIRIGRCVRFSREHLEAFVRNATRS